MKHKVHSHCLLREHHHNICFEGSGLNTRLAQQCLLSTQSLIHMLDCWQPSCFLQMQICSKLQETLFGSVMNKQSYVSPILTMRWVDGGAVCLG